MDNASITALNNNLYKIVPNKGFVLKDKVSGNIFSEAVTGNVGNFEVVEESEYI